MGNPINIHTIRSGHVGRFKLLFSATTLAVMLAIVGRGFYLHDLSYYLGDYIDFITQHNGSQLAYWLRYEFPPEINTAAAVLGFASVPTQSATTTNAVVGAIPVLLYHGTPPEGNDDPPLPQNVFVDQLRALKADGWQTITLEQFKAFMKDGVPVPAKSFLLTFDDGRKESFYPADPVLKDLGYNAIMFVITGFSMPNNGAIASSNFYVSKTELQYMVNSGRWELESHGDLDHALYDVPAATSTNGVLSTLHGEHFLSNKFWLQDVGHVETDAQFTTRTTNDLQTSKDELQNDFGKPVIAYAYPFNDYGENSVNYPDAINTLSTIVPSIYTFAFYQVDPAKDDPFNYADPNTYMIKRIEPTAALSGAELVALLNANAPKSLPYQSDQTWSGWSSNWGKVAPQGDTLSIAAINNTSGAAALLNGSQLWRDYSTTAIVDWQSGDDISLIARYQSDSKPFLSCAFSANRITLEGHTNGVQTTLASTPYTLSATPSDMTVAMSVRGNSATCSAYGKSASATLGSAFIHSGSAGAQIWGERVGDEVLNLKNVSVQAL